MRGIVKVLRGLALVLLLATLALLVWETRQAPVARMADGSRYLGPLEEGLMHGTGRLEWPNGSVYEGEFVRGEMAGQGHLVLAAGEVYQGEFLAGMMHGSGLLELPGGGSYQGEFARDELVQGAYIDDDGLLSEGAFRHWLLHGAGRQHWPGGGEASGEFERGRLVQGQLRDSAGNVYQGQFRDWGLTGEGSLVDTQGNEYRGHFTDGVLAGPGTLVGRDGSRYEGEFLYGVLHGQGRMTFADGSYHDGEFAQGQISGEGRRVSADGELLQEGAWRRGQFVPSVTARQQRIAEATEALLYSQEALLDDALAAVQPADPEQPALYLLAIAGDGTQEVFRREVQYVEEMFRQWFGTDGRSVMLVNSRSTTDRYPMATVTSVRRTLARLAEQMDTERDILFVFLTSHGSSDHQFVLQQRGMTLPALPADTLASLLEDSGIRWKVVLVSACYSGGFIPPLENDQTLVMTAARADRTSFGCTDEADFTYFGGAYFRDTLAADGDFVAAFHTARERVLEREAEAGITVPSEPQIHAPAPILAQLRAWQASRD